MWNLVVCVAMGILIGLSPAVESKCQKLFLGPEEVSICTVAQKFVIYVAANLSEC